MRMTTENVINYFTRLATETKAKLNKWHYNKLKLFLHIKIMMAKIKTFY